MCSEYLNDLSTMENDWFSGKWITDLSPYDHLENDVDFITASFDVSESTGKSLCYLSEKLFVPFELNDPDHTRFLTDFDTNIHFYNTFHQSPVECNYYFYPRHGCDIQGFQAMGSSVQYWPRWFQDFPAISLADPLGANRIHLGICTLPEKKSCFWMKYVV